MSVKKKADGNYETVATTETLIRDAGAAACLGESSLRTFLKLPYCENYQRVAAATALPSSCWAVSERQPLSILNDFSAGMRSASNVRGVMVGRNVTFAPKNEDPRAIAAAVCGIVHQGLKAEEAAQLVAQERGQQMDIFAVGAKKAAHYITYFFGVAASSCMPRRRAAVPP